MNWLTNFIGDQVVARVTSWQTTAAAGLIAYLTNFLTESGVIDPTQVHSLAGQIAQWLLYGISLVLLAWKDRKQDKTPTQPPEKDK